MNGLHLIGDLSGCRCDPQLLLDGAGFKDKCLELVRDAGLTTMDASFHQFEGSGFTGTVVLAESHLRFPRTQNVHSFKSKLRFLRVGRQAAHP